MSRTTLIGYAARYFGLGRRRPFGEGNIAGRSRRFFDKCDIGQIMRVATLSEMLEEIVRLGEATGMESHAHELRGELEGRLATVRAAISGAGSPRVIALECFDPPRVAGFWIPEMISIAGGVDVAGDPGLNPPDVGWGELESLNADVVIVMPAGSVEDAQAQAMEHWERIASLGAGRVFAVDAAAAFVDPGPRLIDGVELLGHLLHPELIDPPGNTAFAALETPVPKSSGG
jgi:iron complex transport system substrate-binding protein